MKQRKQIQKIIFLFSSIISFSAFSQPMKVMSCDTGGFVYSTLEVLDDGQDYHVKMSAGVAFDLDGKLPVLQSLRKGSYSFTISKEDCSVKSGLMSCSAYNQSDRSVTLSDHGSLPEKHSVSRVQFHVQDVVSKSVIRLGDGSPVVREHKEMVVSLLTHLEDQNLEKIGGQLKFEVGQCQVNF